MRRAAVFLIVWGALHAQAPGPELEAVSIRPSPPLMQWSGFQFPGGGLIEGSHNTVRGMAAYAYEVPDFYVSGGPGWASTDRFEIVAKMDPGAEPQQFRAMLRNLLAERFQLMLRHETKEVTVYRLGVAKGGPKLPEAERKVGGIRFRRRGQIEGIGIDMAGVARYLQTLLGQVVEDGTGLTGNYDFKLAWTPDELQEGRPGTQGVAAGQDGGPSIFTALQERLGLKLESSKQAVEALVIQSVERPGGN